MKGKKSCSDTECLDSNKQDITKITKTHHLPLDPCVLVIIHVSVTKSAPFYDYTAAKKTPFVSLPFGNLAFFVLFFSNVSVYLIFEHVRKISNKVDKQKQT